VYPSNADVLIYENTSGSGSGFPAWEVQSVVQATVPTRRASQGSFVINAYTHNRAEASGITGITNPEETIIKRPYACAGYAGRIFFAGIPDSKAANTIYFSQIINEAFDNYEKFYQENDPTDPESSELIATDGGTLTISEASLIRKLVPYQRSLYVFADNGIWRVDGGLDKGFDAENTSVSKITEVSMIGKDSIVETDQGLFFWSREGLMVLAPDQVGGIAVQNVSQNTIQTDYLAIQEGSKRTCRGFYEREANKIYWGYSNDSSDPTSMLTSGYFYDRMLILDLNLNAFYDYEMGDINGKAFTIGFAPSQGYSTSTATEYVTLDGETVTLSGVDVTTTVTTTDYTATNIKFVSVYEWATLTWITFSELSETTFSDWVTLAPLLSETSASYESEILTGWEVLSDGTKEKQIQYLVPHFERTEANFIVDGNGDLVLDQQSSCNLQTRWDFTSTTTPGKWSTSIEAYRLGRYYIPAGAEPFDYGYDVVSTRHKIRGKGRSVQFRFTSSASKDFRLLGWESQYLVNARG
jgi:hypothetical protein